MGNVTYALNPIESADSVFDYIGSNQDAPVKSVERWILDHTNVTKEIAEESVLRWGMGDKEWFNANFKNK